jgi:hypothetical protein
MAQGCRACASREYEFPERTQAAVIFIQLVFQTPDLGCAHGQAAGYAEIPPEIEQIVLYIFQLPAQDFFEILCKQQAYAAVQLIHGTDSLDAQAFLPAPAAIPESRGAVVSSTCVDSGQAISHMYFPGFRSAAPQRNSTAIIVRPCRA